MSEKTVDIVFDGPPSHEAPRFVEVERDGKSIKYGEWIEREDGYWALRVPDGAEIERLRGELRKERKEASDAQFGAFMAGLGPSRWEGHSR